MKILELRFQNLNSLYGEWFIDFTDPEYVSNGIFALTGPTGAGKSTILDAICLALYGTTPRLGKISQSGNEIMSRQTGECYAEVLFESQEGRFRCHWTQHRARKKAEGALQSPRHEISEGVEDGKVIENQIRRVATVIEEKTGMDFERFTRSMLLAQGGFDTFLKADVEQKSKILEQITGTEIYTDISRRVHERQREERESLNLLLAEVSGITILTPEQEKEIQREQAGSQKQEVELAKKTDEASKSIAWLNGIEELKKEMGVLSEESEKLQAELEFFKPERERQGRALKAATLDGKYATLTSERRQQESDQTSLKTDEGRLPDLESSFKQRTEVLKAAEQQTLKAKEDRNTASPIIQRIRAIDQRLVEQKKAVAEGEESHKKDSAKIDSDKQSRLKELQKRAEVGSNLKLVETYLHKHSQDEWLVSNLAGVEEQLGSLIAKQKDIAGKASDQKKAGSALEQATQKLDDCTKQSGTRKQELEATAKNLQQGKDVLLKLLEGRLLRECRTEKDTLHREMAFRAKIAELEDHRTKLEDGQPCPLCGAKEHPFAEGNVPVLDEIEKKIEALTKLITKAENQEAVIKKFEETQGKAGKDLTESEKLETAAIHEKKTVEKTLSDLKEGMGKVQAEFAGLKQAVSAKLQPLGIAEIPDSGVSSLLESLRAHLKNWQAQIKQKADIEKQLAELGSELKRLDAVIETQNNALGEKQRNLEILKKEYAAGNEERQALYGDKKPDDEERRITKAIADAEEVEKRNRALRDERQQKLIATKTNVESLKKRVNQREAELKKLGSDFVLALQNTGFSDEKQFLDACLATPERDELQAKAKGLDDRQTDLKARQKDRETRLAVEVAKKLTDKTLDVLEPQFKDLEDNLKQLRDFMAGLKQKLTENTVAKERIKEKQASIDAQKKECRRWEKLHGLIGSADGKKYRNFAQGLTFELMVSHANKQLEKMTDRYLLIRDDEQPLELNVVDNYQAGEIRSTRNLSGGESFIVSLTLALGLSKMASRKVRVDSLFLDEGFGTLDEDALETALETLSSLPQDGKLVGIISHVSALKERISTQISINPVSGGRSTITGPGCANY